MATINLSNITDRGTKAVFLEKMATAPNVYEKHCMMVPSDAPDEQYVWPGLLPVPREMISGRNLQGIMDFTFTVTNKTYEMSFIINRETLEDDRHGMLNSRIQQMAEVWATYYDYLFAALLSEGDTLTDTYDGSAFHHGTRTVGASAAIDNLRTSAVSTTGYPTAAEVLLGLQDNLAAMSRYQDDKGRPGYNALAMRRMAAIIPPEYERGFSEAINSTLLSSSDNPWGKGLIEFDVLPYLPAVTTDDAYYLSAIGAERKPFLFQKRDELEVVVYNDGKDIAENDGLKVLSRQRFRFGYGEFRRNVRHDYT